MSFPRPFTAYPGIVERNPNFVDLQVRDRAEVLMTRLYGAPTIEDAYGALATSGLSGSGGTMFAEAQKGTSFVSKTWRRHQLPEESRAGMTRYYFNPDDFVVPAAPPASLMPPDDAVLFVRLQEFHYQFGWMAVPLAAPLNGGTPILGPIRVVPPPTFYAEAQPAITLAGIAPANTGCVVDQIPVIDETVQTPLPLFLILPSPGKIITVVNNEAPGTGLLCGAGFGSVLSLVDGGGSAYFEGGIKDLVLAGVGANTAAFSIYGTFRQETA